MRALLFALVLILHVAPEAGAFVTEEDEPLSTGRALTRRGEARGVREFHQGPGSGAAWPEGGPGRAVRSKYLRLDRNLFHPGETLEVHFTTEEAWPKNAYLGTFPASAPHGMEGMSKHFRYEYTRSEASGTRRFLVPEEPGQYQVRITDRKEERASVDFEVRPLSLGSSLSIDFRRVYPGVKFPVRFTAPPVYKKNAFVGIYPADAAPGKEGKGKHLRYEYLQGETAGTREFPAPSEPGSYQLRLYDRHYQLAALSFEVGLDGGGASLWIPPAQRRIYPGQKLSVHFTAPGHFVKNSWVGVYPADAPDGMEGKSHHGEYHYLQGESLGTRSFTAPRDPGHYTVRMYDRKREVIRVPLEVALLKGNSSLSIPPNQRMIYPGQPLTVRFTAPEWFVKNSWIGVYPAHAKPGMEGKDSHLRYEYTKGETEGEREFPAPSEPGEYTLRMYDRRQLVTQVAFEVALLKGGASLWIPPAGRVIYPGQPLTVRFTAPEWFAKNSWIGVYPAHAKPGMEGKDSHLRYEYTQGETEGEREFPAPDEPGEYTLRMYDRRQLVTQVAFEVALLKGDASLGLSAREVAPGEPVEVSFTAPPWFAKNSWIGVYPPNAKPGMEGKDQHTRYEYTQGETAGTRSFPAPREPGEYTIRMYDRRQLVVSETFQVKAR